MPVGVLLGATVAVEALMWVAQRLPVGVSPIRVAAVVRRLLRLPEQTAVRAWF